MGSGGAVGGENLGQAASAGNQLQIVRDVGREVLRLVWVLNRWFEDDGVRAEVMVVYEEMVGSKERLFFMLPDTEDRKQAWPVPAQPLRGLALPQQLSVWAKGV